MSFTPKEALEYHSKGRPGKVEVIPSKPCATQLDLSLAYTPGVAVPCLEIEKHPEKAYDYTVKGNLVAVITDGSAVLGLGNIGALAGKPVMEGKGVLFKRFADIDVFDIELATQDPDLFIQTVALLEPTFGGINLEDIKAPECFYIEEELRKKMNIPIFHDDQHGTAIICGAALINGLELVNKKIEDVKIVFSGAGAASVACAKLYLDLGAQKENLTMVDSKGVIYEGRTERMNPYKAQFARKTEGRTLADAMVDADVFVGCSVKGIVKPEMVAAMAPNPLIFAMANPDPEISPEEVAAIRTDAIMATGRSDYPNQVNNVLGFPFIFRGALDVRAREINEAMKVAATHALAQLAKEEVPDDVLAAYDGRQLQFGPEYIIPTPFDSRVLYRVAPAVAKAAMDSGVAGKPIEDFRAYTEQLERLLHPEREILRGLFSQARSGKKMRIVFPEGDHEKILRACRLVIAEGTARPILLGNPDEIRARILELGLEMPEDKFEVIDVWGDTALSYRYAEEYRKLRERKGMTLAGAQKAVRHRINFAMMMVKLGEADGCVSGLDKVYPETIRPALEVVGLADNRELVCGMYMVLDRQGKVRFFADTTVNVNPSSEQLAQIAISVADSVSALGITPRVAMLSFSNFGSARNAESSKIQRATEIAKRLRPELMLDGEMRVDVAVNPAEYINDYPFCALKEEANVFIFPSLNAGNISYQLMQFLGGMEVVGPILIGLDKPINALPRQCDVNSIANMTAITSVIAKRQK